MAEDNPESKPPPAAPRPFWWPGDVPIEEVPESLRAALLGIVQPAYEHLVLGARPGLQQSAGATVVQFLWLEVLQQTELSQDLLGAGQNLQRLQKHERAIGRLLRLAGAKMKASDFLLRLQAHHQKLLAAWGKSGPPPGEVGEDPAPAPDSA